MPGRVLFHVQYLLGVGHLQRSLRIAEALSALGIEVTLVQGGPPAPEVDRACGVRIVQLSPIHARDATFALVDEAGQPVGDALRAERRRQLLAALAEVLPDAVVIEGFPFARRAFRFELDPLIAEVRASAPRPRLICSVRDIPTVRSDPARIDEIVASVRENFDAVLVHGDSGFIPFDVPFPAAPRIADCLRYTGYVTTTHLTLPIAGAMGPLLLPPKGRRGDGAALAGSLSAPGGGEGGDEVGDAEGQGDVLVSVGGGAAGRPLLAAALDARRQGCLAERGWRILAGTSLSDEALERLRQDAPAGVAVERFRRDFAALLRRCYVSVSQAGYNTVMDILAAKTRAVLVPFAAERETEQLIRAEQLAARGAVEMVREDELSPTSLGAAIERAASRDPLPIAIDTDGAWRSAALIAGLIAK